MMRGINAVSRVFSDLKSGIKLMLLFVISLVVAYLLLEIGHGLGRRERRSFLFTAANMKLARASTRVLHSQI
jgi:hypothetical protein